MDILNVLTEATKKKLVKIMVEDEIRNYKKY